MFLDPVILYQLKGFVFQDQKIYVQAQAFDPLMESLSSGVGHFCHMIKLMKYHVTKHPGRLPGAHIQSRDSMSEPGELSSTSGTYTISWAHSGANYMSQAGSVYQDKF